MATGHSVYLFGGENEGINTEMKCNVLIQKLVNGMKYQLSQAGFARGYKHLYLNCKKHSPKTVTEIPSFKDEAVAQAFLETKIITSGKKELGK